MTFQYAERLIDAIGGHSVVINHLGEALNRTLFALMVFLIQPFYLSKDHLTCCSFSSYDCSFISSLKVVSFMTLQIKLIL
jgi:hypothetical protein